MFSIVVESKWHSSGALTFLKRKTCLIHCPAGPGTQVQQFQGPITKKIIDFIHDHMITNLHSIHTAA